MRFAVSSQVVGACVLALALMLPASAGAGEESVARQWNELLLSAIRSDFARPTVHARNLFHTSVAMWDAWAAYDPEASNYLHMEKILVPQWDLERARETTISYAAFRILSKRFYKSPGWSGILAALGSKMHELGLRPAYTSTVGPSPAALGNRIAATVLEHYHEDGANEEKGYVNRYYQEVNHPLLPDLPGQPSSPAAEPLAAAGARVLHRPERPHHRRRFS